MMKLLFTLTILILASCAQIQQNWIEQNCNEGSAYSAGVEDAQNGQKHYAGSFGICEKDKIGTYKKAYSQGYNSVSKEQSLQIVVNEVHTEKNRPHYLKHKKTHHTHNYYECKISAFTSEYSASHYNKQRAEEIALSKCQREHNKMHCRIDKCKNYGPKAPKPYFGKQEYTCRIQAFTDNYNVSHLSFGKANFLVQKKCMKKHHRMHCEQTNCNSKESKYF